MRFLVDANMSPRVARILTDGGHDAVAVRDLGLHHAPDDQILEHALTDDRVIISHDTDFGTLLAVSGQSKPSFILVRSADPLTAEQLGRLLLDNLNVMTNDLTTGAIITLARGHLRSRRQPLR
jgi:predicted nuclease of predicted toxin-antitoxin system